MCAIIYNSNYDSDNIFDSSRDTTIAAISHYSAFSTSPKHYQNHYYNKYHEGILEIANSLLKILTNQIVDKTMVGAVKEM